MDVISTIATVVGTIDTLSKVYQGGKKRIQADRPRKKMEENPLINVSIKSPVSIDEADAKTLFFIRAFNFTGNDSCELNEKYILTLDISNIGREEITEIKISDFKIGPYTVPEENSCDFNDFADNTQTTCIDNITIAPNAHESLNLVFETTELEEGMFYSDILAIMDITIYSKDSEQLFEVGIFMTKEKTHELEGSYTIEHLIIHPLDE